MKRLAVCALFAISTVACAEEEVQPELRQASALEATWRAPNATLALTPHPYNGQPFSYVYVAPNGAAAMGGFSVDGDRLLLGGFPPATFALAGDTLIVTLPDTQTTYTRGNNYCTPTPATQSCQ